MPDALIGLDVGGGSVRATLQSLRDDTSTTARRALSARPVPGSGGLAFDLDLPAIWKAIAECTREVLERSQTAPEEIQAVAACAMRLGTVLVGPDDQVLHAVPNRDARAVGPGLQLATQHGDELADRMGRWPIPIFTAARLRQLADDDPELLPRARAVLSISDWVTWKLCGEIVAEPSQAGESLLFDLATGDWAWDWIDRLELPPGLFPNLRRSGEVAGPLNADAASALGLAPGTPVAIGGADTQCALLASGAVRAGDTAVVAGTTTPVEQIVDTPLVDPSHRLWTGHHVIPGRYLVESNAGPAGEALHWFSRVLFPDDPQPEARLFGEAGDSPPGAKGLLSTFGAQVFDATSMAIPVGDLTLTHLSSVNDERPRAHMLRAFIEGLAFAVRANIEQLTALTGSEPELVRLAGGLSRSDSFSQILADTLSMPVATSTTPEASSVGAALCAGVAAGVYADLETAGAASPARRFEARATSSSNYESWNQLRSMRRESQTMASALATPAVLAASAAAPESGQAKTRPRVLICADFDDDSLARLREFADVEYAPFRQKMRLLRGQALVEALANFDVFVTEIDLVDADALSKLPGLRLIGACRGDAVNVDVRACSAYGIPVVHAPGRNADAVADLTLAFLLMLARKLPAASTFLHGADVEAGDMGKMGQAFGSFRGRELWKKTVGLIGLGAVGRGVAHRLRGFGARVLVHDPFVDAEQAAVAGAESVSFDELLAESDFVSLHAAVVDATRDMIDADAIAKMKPGAFLINTARAALTDETALAQALATGQLGGAAFDTFSIEPPGATHPLLQFEQVIATPHVGGNTEDVAAHQGEIIVAELRRMVMGQQPLHALDPRALEGFDFTAPRKAIEAAAVASLEEGEAPAVTDLQKRAPKPKAAVAPAAPPVSQKAPASSAATAQAKSQMKKVLEAFVAACCGDASMAAFSEGRDVTLHFQLLDIDLEFHLRLHDGAVAGRVGAPDERAPVELRMNASVIDAMFSGRSDPMRDAMEGRLSFTGDPGKAMAIQEMQPDLQRVYLATVDELGAPQGLDGLGSASAPAPVAENDLRSEIVGVVTELYAADLITATGGNVSARCSEDEAAAWITPSQLFKGDLHSDVMVQVDLEGRPIGGSSRSPSSEWGMHCAVYAARADVHAVIHAHASHATILANTGLPFLPISTEAAFFGEIPRIPFVMPGTSELADQIVEALAEGWAVLMQNHGLLVAGRSLRRAADMAEIIERSAEVILGCHAVGREPPVLPDEVIEELRRMGDLVA